MRNTAKCFLACGFTALAVLATVPGRHVLAQGQGQARPPQPAQPQSIVPDTLVQPTFRLNADLVSTDVMVRDAKGQFVADLKPTDFEIYEDGVKQEITSFMLSHGGRTFNQKSPTPVVAQEGVFLPQSRPTSDASGRLFIVFIDDQHLDFGSTPKTRELIKKMLKNIIHEGDMFGIVTTGPSSVSQQLTYDRQILEAAINRITGNALKPSEILNRGSWGSQGPLEVRHRAHVTFETLYDLLGNLERVQNRKKAILYLSSGYDFNPFERSRFEQTVERLETTAEELAYNPFQIVQESQNTLNEADLIAELTMVTRAARRANAVIYTIDPRGLIAGQDMAEEINMQDFRDHVMETQTTLRVLAEETGGIAIVNQNDFDKGMKRIDAETSDYYLIGFYSSNPDPLKRNRKLEVKALRPGLTIQHRPSYSLRPIDRRR